MAIEDWAPLGIDPTVPSVARVYDYMIGGKNNFAVDRAVAELAYQMAPATRNTGYVGRAFLRRVVRYLARDAGIHQFLDLGSGLPTQGNVHEVAHETDPTIRVVYVDNDPMALAHGRALLADSGTTIVVNGDIRRPAEILADWEVTAHLNFSQPIGILMISILHHVNDQEDPGGIAATLRAAMCPGSYLAIAHFRNPGDLMPDVAKIAREEERIFNEKLGTGRWRSQEEILSYFGNFEVLEPGLVPLAEWRPDPGDTIEEDPYPHYAFVGGVARKP